MIEHSYISVGSGLCPLSLRSQLIVKQRTKERRNIDMQMLCELFELYTRKNKRREK